VVANVVDIEALVGEFLSRFGLRLGAFDLIENPAGDIPDFADEFSQFISVNTRIEGCFDYSLAYRLWAFGEGVKTVR
jgi:hypothetical protein